MSNHEELITQFTNVTGIDSERAQFYLESCSWQLEVALANFFGNYDREDGEEPVDNSPLSQADLTTTSKMDKNVPSDSSKVPESSAQSKSTVKTMKDLRSSESTHEDAQAFYAGGSEHSGQQVLGPSKNNEFINDIFKTCREQSNVLEKTSSDQPKRRVFEGTGYKLGQTNNDTEVILRVSSDQPTSGAVTLKLWQNGFTVNDRELRSYTDPGNKEFLTAIKQGEIPPEIYQELQGQELRLDMEDHRHEVYAPSKSQVRAFTGKGHTLGSPSPTTASTSVPTTPVEEDANNVSLARSQLNLNSSDQLTTIQIRLADGSNIRQQFNLTHTIADLRQFIAAIRPQYAARGFQLLTTYPSKELADDNKTIQEMNLQNSSILQRLR